MYPSDFVVEEISELGIPASKIQYQREAGSYLLCLVKRENLTHSSMINHISKFFGVSNEDIGVAGIKDKRAIVQQLLSVFNPRQNQDFENQQIIKGLQIVNLGWRKKGIVRGHLNGNRFQILVRGVEHYNDDDLHLAENVLTFQPILNFYGPQRFGCTRPVNHLVGRALLEGDYETALKLYIGMPHIDPNHPENKIRTLFTETMDAGLVLKEWVNVGHEERSMLSWLNKRQNDFQGAFNRLSSSTQSVLRRSFVSYLWNLYLSKRPGNAILKGERTAKIGNRENVEIALPSKKWQKPLNEIWSLIFEDLGITSSLFRKEKHTSRLAFLNVSGLSIEPSPNNAIEVRFCLGTGQYATVLLRELMKSDIKSYC